MKGERQFFRSARVAYPRNDNNEFKLEFVLVTNAPTGIANRRQIDFVF